MTSETFRCWAEIDLSALRHNMAVVRGHIGHGSGLMAVVKANAYGHGIEGLALELIPLVDMFGVANVGEAEQLRRMAPATPILILGPALPEERESLVRNGFIPVVSSVEEALDYGAIVESAATSDPTRVGPGVPLHLAVDTGMGRIGVWQEQALEVARAIASIPWVRLTGVATHLPVADEDTDWTDAQLANWEDLLRQLSDAGIEVPIVHSLNSAGTINYDGRRSGSDSGHSGDMVRAGLMLYGSSPINEFQERLRPVLAWKSRITLIRDVPAGRGVSYGRTFITPHAMRIATVAVGYGDGYQRHLSNSGAQVLVGGRRCAVLGRVTMDQILVDVSAVAEVLMGDEVVLIGQQGEEEILAGELAAKAGTIAWEIFTGIGTRVVRRYIGHAPRQG